MTYYKWIVMLAILVALLLYGEQERFLGCHVGSSQQCRTEVANNVELIHLMPKMSNPGIAKQYSNY